jgi:hypothetical protein
VTTPPPWPPRTEAQLKHAMDNKLLIESHKLDLKQDLKPSESATRGIAKDLAAFSVDGGVIIIGVAETDPLTLTPIPLDGLGERVEQIGLTTVDEPVRVTTFDIQSEADPAVGYLVIEVPVSGRAPHMVDGRYYDRGNLNNIVLSDSAVQRWHEGKSKENSDLSEQARDELEQLTAGIPQPVTNLLLLAQPLGAREDLLMGLQVSTSYKADTADLLHAASIGCHEPISALREPTEVKRDALGIAAITDLTPSTDMAGSKRAELVFSDAGTLTLRSGGLIRAIPRIIGGVLIDGPTRYGILEPLIIGHAELLVRVAGEVSKYGFNGPWRFAVAATRLGGRISYTLAVDPEHDERLSVYNRASYERATRASRAEIVESPNVVVRALVAPLLRALGSGGDQWPWLFAS